VIPVRVRMDARPVLATDRRMELAASHPMALEPCPVCDVPLGPADGPPEPVVLVFVGVHPADRYRATGEWGTGAAVAVHAACAGVTS
jgi:hypothetical protein